MRGFACVRVDAFSAAALERWEPSLVDFPLAVLVGVPPATRVREANTLAREQGVLPELSEAQARARCPELVGRVYSEEAVASAREALLLAALAVSPRVQDDAPGRVMVDLAGLGALFRNEAAVGERLLHQAAAVGLSAHVGIAATRTAAWVAAGLGPRLTIVAAGDEARVLGGAPLCVLDLEDDLVAILARWGLCTVGSLAALPRRDIGARLGGRGLEAHDRARGRDRRPFRVWTPPAYWEEAEGLDWEIQALDALAMVLERVLTRLCARLEAGHMAAEAVTVRLTLVTGHRHERIVALATPMREVAPLLTVLRLALERDSPSAAVTGVALIARAVPHVSGQGRLGESMGPAPSDLAAVLARLAALVGPDNVGSPRPSDTHRPDDFTLARLRCDAAPGYPAAATTGDFRVMLRRLRPPRPVEVHTDGERPIRLRGRSHREEEVVRSAGPWRSSGEWWDIRPWARDEWDLALSDGTVCRVGLDRLQNAWFLDGVYD